MKQVLYVDILAAVSLFVNYFILTATSKFFCIKLKTSRLIWGELISIIFSMYIFLPEPAAWISFLIKLAMACAIVLTVFEIKSFKMFLKILACFYSISFAFSGIMFFVWCIWKPKGMIINNGVVYFNISPVILIFSTVIAYASIEIINRVTGKKEIKNRWCDIKVSFEGKNAVFKAKIDTCNSLKEPFSNLPVIVARSSTISSLFPENINFELNSESNTEENIFKKTDFKMRIVPFKTVSGEGILPAFKPDFIYISDGIKKQAYIAVCSNKILPRDIPALMSPELID